MAEVAHGTTSVARLSDLSILLSENTEVKSIQLQGFCEASESAYAEAAYLRVLDKKDSLTLMSLDIAKTKVAQIKRSTIPTMELCGAVLLARLLSHVRNVF